MHIRFDVPADPAYAGRVAALMSGLYLRKYRMIGLVLIAFGLLGLYLPLPGRADYDPSPVFATIIAVGVLSMLFPLWMRYAAKRRAGAMAVDGSYEIDAENIMMRSGTDSHGIAWEGVTRIVETDEFWVVYVDRIAATVIPRRLMAPADEQTLRGFLVQRGWLPAA
ncbi:YcxB family protein [Dactylosporangium sp. AC04546]|uniref:YcxB family protein n=1 Tax=Dactylosporangium sp. AC04546 TaxID=2862460 RepID=UPI001EDE66D6|nr:YcxB family protein [Dactylosporangium sp. AC04546]WVK89252.1 YcxB family protein [Dactylosporangium sp. AC04546]